MDGAIDNCTGSIEKGAVKGSRVEYNITLSNHKMKGENMAREKGMGNLQREKSGRWTMRVGINGKRYCRSTRTKDRDQAERTLQRFLAPFGLGEHRLPLADVWNAYVVSPNRNELAPSTLNVKRIAWMHFAKWMKHNYLPVSGLADVTADMIAEYLAVLRADLCASSYNGRVCILREIFRTLATKAGLEENPWEGVRLRPDDSHSRRELTMDELKRLLDAAKRVGGTSEKLRVKSEELNKEGLSSSSSLIPPPSNSTSEWYKLILIGIYTGLRLGDCCLLDWSQINLAQQVIQLIPQKTKRHAHGRPVTIPIHPALGQALLGNEAHPSSLIGPVLPAIAALYGRSRWQVSHEITSIFKAANIKTSVLLAGRKHRTPEATFHSLRHTFVSFAANAGVPLHIVQSIVGHSSTAMTRHYYHENIDALKNAVAAIPAL